MTEILGMLGGKLESWGEAVVLMAPNLIAAVAIVVVFGYASKLGARGAARLLRRMSNHKALNELVAKLVRFTVLIVGVLVGLHILHLDKAATTFLAGAGIIGIAIGFAFQDMSANFISGVAMAFKRPIAVGDLVETNDILGTVDRIELRTTVILTQDGRLVRIPNKEIYQKPIINLSKRKTRRVEIPVGVHYDDDLERAAELAVAAVEPIERDSERDIELYYTSFGDSSIDMVVRFWIAYYRHADYLQAQSEAIMRIKRAFDEGGITIPFPIRTLDLGDEDLEALATATIHPRREAAICRN